MRKLIAILFCGLLSSAAHAHVAETPLDTSVMACLQRRAEPISYPARDEQLKAGGRLRVSLRFTAPDQPPVVEVLFRAASDAIVNEVRTYLQAYRLPCLLPEAGAVLAVQEFDFTPRAIDPITWTAPRRVADTAPAGGNAAAASLACLRRPTDRPWIEDSGLVRDTRRQVNVSNVIVEALFDTPDQPPRLKVLYSTISKPEERNVLAYIEQFRLPCFEPGSPPVGKQYQFQFRKGGAPLKLKDVMPLVSFLAAIKDIESARVAFDFDTMACPFQVAWTLGKPALDNRVAEVGPTNLNRAEFLAWLREVQMKIDPAQYEDVLGGRTIIQVPCGRLTLAPGG